MGVLVALLKACLEAGSGTDAAQFTGGRSLGHESLHPKKRKRKPKPGSGELITEIEEDAAAGVRKYGKKRMARLAAAGRARKSLRSLIDEVRRGG